MSSIDVIIITYNSADLLGDAVESVRAQTAADQVQITVLDNASGDDSVAAARRLGLAPIVYPRNVGFGAAVNDAVAAGSGDYVVLLNPDATLGDPKCLDAMRSTLDDEQVGIVGARMVTADGAPYPNGRKFPSTTTAARHALMGLVRPRNRGTRAYFGDPGRTDADQTVDWVSGCCLMMRRSLWEQVGGFDRRYWMYLEDADLAWRLRELGYRTVLSGPAWVIHQGGRSSRTRPTKSLWHHHRSALVFYSRTRTGSGSRALLPVAAAGLGARLAVLVAINTVRRLTTRT